MEFLQTSNGGLSIEMCALVADPLDRTQMLNRISESKGERCFSFYTEGLGHPLRGGKLEFKEGRCLPLDVLFIVSICVSLQETSPAAEDDLPSQSDRFAW